MTPVSKQLECTRKTWNIQNAADYMEEIQTLNLDAGADMIRCGFRIWGAVRGSLVVRRMQFCAIKNVLASRNAYIQLTILILGPLTLVWNWGARGE